MRSAIVVGGGIAGLSVAIGLSGAGWAVAIYERTARIEPVGAALSLWPNAISALTALGVGSTVLAAGAPLRTMLLADRRGKPIIGPRPVPASALMITRAALQSALVGALGAVPLNLGRSVQRVAPTETSVRVELDDGQCLTADLLIDAAGISSVIDHAQVDHPATYCGYGGVLALSNEVDGSLDGLAAEYWGWGERFGLFELPNQRRYWFYMHDQAEDAAPVSHAEVSARAIGWLPHIAQTIAATPAERLIPFAVKAKRPPRALGKGRVISIGDAAHAMEPNLGQGACQALEDAAALMVVADLAPPAMVAALEKLRLARVRAVVRQSKHGRYGAHGPRLGQLITRMLLRSVPMRLNERIMRSVQTMPSFKTEEVCRRRA